MHISSFKHAGEGTKPLLHSGSPAGENFCKMIYIYRKYFKTINPTKWHLVGGPRALNSLNVSLWTIFRSFASQLGTDVRSVQGFITTSMPSAGQHRLSSRDISQHLLDGLAQILVKTLTSACWILRSFTFPLVTTVDSVAMRFRADMFCPCVIFFI